MLVIALTGNPSSGKTSVLKLLKKKGALVFDADKNIHDYYRNKKSPVYKKVVKAFPESLSGSRICRRKLAKIVFSDHRELAKLEKIVHPVVIRDMLDWVSLGRRQAKKVLVAEIPLLFEKKLQAHFDIIILVKLKPAQYRRRLNKLYGSNKGLALKRLGLMKSLGEKIKGVDFVIDNSENINQLKKEVDSLWKKLKEK
ncbi:MAG: dephospho-CoA kinase [Candidatus Omnitrophica bacterium]|nr:dephospho-CoA kinase [Candidatus Omnitrophota bacterium]MBU2044373.1 dephospho-CoA kinase [Candidatus Omnitrophota bacterium]MBU2250921.1 dephospho-CoA kinase [Candidatus Omnitrophota bacterium]MBU2266141.1 dephospho-CoA kinase [Candidatus Omnitrophota bacterium]MBU2473784.1 dephospho-CoA kinase [Candidatus Omnitrophota bacterium]